MRRRILALGWFGWLAAILVSAGPLPGLADPPRMMNFQGRVQVNGTNFSGAGKFRFAMVDSGILFELPPPRPPIWLYQTYWSHDGTSSGGSMPGSVVSVPVVNGLYSVMLGETNLTNMTQEIPPGVFTNSAVYMRIWFDDGVHGVQQLTPDQRIASTAYALQAATVEAGAITTGMLADGAVTGAKIKSGTVSLSQLDDDGQAAYDKLLESARSFGQTNPLPFEALLPAGRERTGELSVAFSLDGSPFGTVAGFIGHEGMSEPYEFVVEVIVGSATLEPSEQMGRLGQFTFTRNDQAARFAGLVTGCSMASDDGTGHLYTFRLASPLAYLALSANYRVYQDITVPDLVSGFYREKTSYDLDSSALQGSYAPRTYVVQHAETDLNFFTRLLEDEGIFYLFRQGAGLPTLLLGDAMSSYLPGPYSSLPYYGDLASHIPLASEYIRTFQKAIHESTRRATLGTYDFTKSGGELQEIFDSQVGRGEVYHYGSPIFDHRTLEAMARSRGERFQAERNTISGSGNAAGLRPGYTFRLEDGTASGLEDTYLVTAIRHAAFRRVTNGVANLFYGNQFEVIPASLPYRPALKAPKPAAQTCTAIVTGPAGEEIYTDKYGRVKVQFRWDRLGSLDETSSAWIRVASLWAGKNWGAIFLPRIGQEVMVDFLYSDPDQPVITGRLYNQDQMPPYDLPDNKTVSGIKTRSSKGGTPDTYNEIKFDDKKGSELLSITAEKNLDLLVGHDTLFNTDHDLSMDVANDTTIDMGRDTRVNIGHNLTLTANGAMDITAPTLDLSIGGDVTTTIGHNLALAVSGTMTVTAPKLNLSASQMNLGGTLRLSDQAIWLRGGDDTFHGLSWFASDTFAGVNPDGPVLFGCSGGALGTMCGAQQLALAWNDVGNVMVDPGSLNNGALLPGLTFGLNSGEGIASRRTAGGNQFGLDFYTFGSNRLSIANGGNVGIGTNNPARRLQVVDGDGVGASIQMGAQLAGATPKLIYFGDGDFVRIGESGADDRLELKGTSVFFNSSFVGISKTNPVTALDVNGTVTATAFSGYGASLTSLNASQLSSGTVGVGRLPVVVVTNFQTGVTLSGTFSGNGGGLTNLNGSQIAAGTVADARLSANVALRNATQTFSGQNTFSSSVGIGGPPAYALLDIQGTARLNDHDLYLRANNGDLAHGLGYYGSPKLFGGANVNGPVLYGNGGGALGSINGTTNIALQWDNNRNVSIGGSLLLGSSVVLIDKDLYLHGDLNHGLGWYGNTRPFAGQAVDGPVVYGWSGGALGTVQTGVATNLALTWKSTGNVGIGTNTPNQKLVVAGNIYATGTITPNSDRNQKTDFAAVDPAAVLDRVAKLPIQQWRFKAESEDTKHLGPMAQDFRTAFGLGEISTAIATVDADGVALAAIQGLNEKVEVRSQKAEDSLRKLETENAELRRQNQALEERLAALEKLVLSQNR